MKVVLLKIIMILSILPLIYFWGIKITAFIVGICWFILAILLSLNNKIYDKYVSFAGTMPSFFNYLLDRKNSILVCFMYSIFLVYMGFTKTKNILKLSFNNINIVILLSILGLIMDYLMKKYIKSIFAGVLLTILVALFLFVIIISYYLKFNANI